MKPSRATVKKALDYFVRAKVNLPQYSKIGTNNYNEIDEIERLFTYYLYHGGLPDMSDYLEETSYTYALWLLGKYNAMNDFLKEILEDE